MGVHPLHPTMYGYQLNRSKRVEMSVEIAQHGTWVPTYIIITT